MGYMSYCRFEGTRSELQACMDTVQEHLNREAEYSVSETEIEQFEGMIREIVDFLYDTGILNGKGDLDDKRMNEICYAMAVGS